MGPSCQSRAGFTLIECLLAGALIVLAATALLQGVGVANRIARENAELLAADALAWDALWKKFNEDYDAMRSQTTETLSEAAAPELYLAGSPAKLTVSVSPLLVSTDGITVEMKTIAADVEWGPSNRRTKLSDWQPAFVYRSSLGRVPWD